MPGNIKLINYLKKGNVVPIGSTAKIVKIGNEYDNKTGIIINYEFVTDEIHNNDIVTIEFYDENSSFTRRFYCRDLELIKNPSKIIKITKCLEL